MRAPLAIYLLALSAACGGSTAATNPDTRDSGGGAALPFDAGVDSAEAGCPAPPTAPGASVGGPCVDAVLAEDHGGGLRPAPPPGSDCDLGVASYTYTVAAKSIVWSRCVAGARDTDPYKKSSGTHAVSASEADAIAVVLASVTVTDLRGCASDASL